MNLFEYLKIKECLTVPMRYCIGMVRYCFFLLGFVVSVLLVSGCSSSAEDFYVRMPARFRVQYVQTIPPLNAALNGMGEFATIKQRNGAVYIYSNLQSSIQRPMTAVEQRQYVLGVSGFIVGLPNIPPLGYERSVVVCYDLACPNCYSESYLTREMQLQSGGFCSCALCSRVYDLNNQGYVVKGEAGKSLFRYRASYQNQVFWVNN